MTAIPFRLLDFFPRWISIERQISCTTMVLKSSRAVSYECAHDCPFHGFTEKLDNAKSRGQFGGIIKDLTSLIYVASREQEMTPCIVEVIRDCIEACRRTKLPIGPLVEFYDFRTQTRLNMLNPKTIPTSVILHSPKSDEQFKTSTRHLLLQTYLDEIPPTPVVLDELYMACAEKGYNNYFKRIRLANLKQLQARGPQTHATHTLDLPAGLIETLNVAHDAHGFKLNCFVPDMLQRLQLGLAISIEFVAKGKIWGLYIQTQRGQCDGPLGWDIVLCIMRPSENDLKGSMVASFDISRYEKGFCRGSTGFVLHLDRIEALGFPAKGAMPETQALWLLSSSMAQKCYQCINKDGSCYLTLDFMIKPTSGNRSP